MCTINKVKVNKSLVGWKVVRVTDGFVKSFMFGYTWTPKAVNVSTREYSFSSRIVGKDNDYYNDDCIFHCFANRSGARKFLKWEKKEYPKYKHYNIIKVILSKEVYTGTVNFMGDLDGLPATCGTHAYWDGKFVR